MVSLVVPHRPSVTIITTLDNISVDLCYRGELRNLRRRRWCLHHTFRNWGPDDRHTCSDQLSVKKLNMQWEEEDWPEASTPVRIPVKNNGGRATCENSLGARILVGTQAYPVMDIATIIVDIPWVNPYVTKLHITRQRNILSHRLTPEPPPLGMTLPMAKLKPPVTTDGSNRGHANGSSEREQSKTRKHLIHFQHNWRNRQRKQLTMQFWLMTRRAEGGVREIWRPWSI